MKDYIFIRNKMSFKKLGLSEPLLKAVKEQGYETPTPIQEQAIPVILQKKRYFSRCTNRYWKNSRFYLADARTLKSC